MKLLNYLRNDADASAVGYGLLVSLIAAGIVTLVGALGGKIGVASRRS